MSERVSNSSQRALKRRFSTLNHQQQIILMKHFPSCDKIGIVLNTVRARGERSKSRGEEKAAIDGTRHTH